MDSSRVPALIALVGVVVAVGLFFLLKDDTADEEAERPATTAAQTTDQRTDQDQEPQKPEKPEEPQVPVVEIKNGEPVGGVQELEFESGDRAEFRVESDVADELHFHGYDLYIDVTPTEVTPVSFDADIEGVFELESHSTGVLVAEISVVP